MKRICLLLFVLMLSILVLYINPLNSSAMFENKECQESGETQEKIVTNSTRSIPGGEEIDGEDWYYIEVDDNCIPLNYQKINYNDNLKLLTYLKPGDIIYETNGSFVGDITGHIGIVYDIVYDEGHNQHYVIMIEVLSDGVGYGLMTPNRLEEKDVIIYRVIDASETQIQGALHFMVSHIDDGFRAPWNKYLNGKIEVDENGNEKTSWYCAELVWAAFMSPVDNNQKIGLDTIDNTNGSLLIAPSRLASHPRLTTILHYTDEDDEYKYETNLINNGATGHTYTCDGDTYTEEHFYRFWNPDEETHTATCACGHTISENHTMAYENLSSDAGHKEYCTVCKYSKTTQHNYRCYGTLGPYHSEACVDCGFAHMGLANPEYTSVNSSNHVASCPDCDYIGEEASHNIVYESFGDYTHGERCTDCGYVSSSADHRFTYTRMVGNRHKKSCLCGYSVTEACMGRAFVGGTSYCSSCGQEITSIPPIIMSFDGEEDALPSSKEDEEYTE